MQDKEVGDGTTSVVILAAELLKVCLHACSRIGAPPTLSQGTRAVLTQSLCIPRRRYVALLRGVAARQRLGSHQDSPNKHHGRVPPCHEGGHQVCEEQPLDPGQHPGARLPCECRQGMIICNVTEAHDTVSFCGLYGFNVCGC